MKTIFEKSEEGQKGYSLPKDFSDFMPDPKYTRKSPLKLPEISELNLMRHFTHLASRNMGIDKNFYPLGSCTMKYNPRINEKAAALSSFSCSHPLSPDALVQGNLEIIFKLIQFLCEAAGFQAGTLLPNAGAQGEFTGIRLIQAYHAKQGNLKDEILVPDNAHGTNPATARMAGYKIIPLKTTSQGDVDLKELLEKVNSRTAGLMLTNPNTVGVFVPSILEVSKIVHSVGGLLYYDGANFNPILMIAEPGAMGFDVMHINLHKTFSTPHGGGGPGSGPVLCHEKLAPFLPVPRVIKDQAVYKVLWDDQESIGHMATFHGNFAVCLKAYLYCLLHGKYGLRKLSEGALINANYLKKGFEKLFTVPFPQPCMHEFVVQADRFLPQGIKASDIAKRLLDYGIHSPTVYFPQIVKECLLIEPTEAESLSTLDHFLEVMQKIAHECETNPEIVKTAPHTQPVTRLDEVKANKELRLIHKD